MAAEGLHPVLRWGRRIAIAVVGSLVLVVGVMMIVLPGPAFVVIPLGLGILSLEFERPRVWLIHVKAHVARATARAREKLHQRRSRH